MQRSSVTMKDLARAAGVSVMTVSRAFRADGAVNAQTREKIIRLADRLGYVPDATAANLRTQRTRFVAVTIPSLNNANFADTVDALSARLSAAGMQVLLGNTGYDIGKEELLIEQLLRRRPEAIVLTGGYHSSRSRKMLQNAGIPVIETWDLPAEPIDYVVGFSNFDAMRHMVDHLVATGRKRLAFIGGDADGDTRGAERRRGYLAGLQAHGLSGHRCVTSDSAPGSMRDAADAMARLLESFPDIDAVLCVSDLVAFGALSECQRRGVSVPDQIAIAGFGAYEIATVSHPRLSTIDPQPREIGAKAAELILELLDGTGAASAPSRLIRIDWRFVSGETIQSGNGSD